MDTSIVAPGEPARQPGCLRCDQSNSPRPRSRSFTACSRSCHCWPLPRPSVSIRSLNAALRAIYIAEQHRCARQRGAAEAVLSGQQWLGIAGGPASKEGA